MTDKTEAHVIAPMGTETFQSGTPTVMHYARQLVEDAETQVERGEYGLAVILAMTAAELATARAFQAAFHARGLEDLSAPVIDLMNSVLLKHKKQRALYAALTGKNPGQETWWKSYCESVELRNDVVHEGKRAGEQDAQTAISSAKALIQFLGQWGPP